MRSRLLVLATVIAAFVLVGIWLRLHPTERPAQAPALPGSPGQAQDRSLSPNNNASATTDREVTRIATTFEAMPAWGQSACLKIVERESNNAVADAVVHVLAIDTAGAEGAAAKAAWDSHDPETFVTAHGTPLFCNLRGEVTLELKGHAWYVCARKDDLFGRRVVQDWESGTQRVEAGRERDLEIVAVDVSGSSCPDLTFSLWESYAGFQLGQVRANPDGRARIHDVVTFLRERNLQETSLFDVRAEIPIIPRPTQRLDLNALPDEPVVITLPDLGRMRFDIAGSDGLPASVAGTLLVREKPDPLFPERAQDTREHVLLDFKDPAQLTVPVLLGREYEVSAETTIGLARGSGPGPRTRGETVTMHLDLDAKRFLAVGRLLDEHGQPLRETQLEANAFWFVDGVVKNATRVESKTDGAGRFAFKAHGQLWIQCASDPHKDRGAVLDLQALPTFGSHDVGDVTLERLRPLVHGRVEDAKGNPIAGAYVVLTRKPEAGNSSPALFLAHANPTPEDGSFSIFAPCTPGQLSLVAFLNAQSYRQSDQDTTFVCGSTPVERIVRMDPLGRIVGTALFEDEAAKQQVELRLSSEVVATGNSHNGRFDFNFNGVQPGRHTIVVARSANFLADLGQEIMRIEDVEVRAGEVTHDPRLEPMDLRMLVHVPHPAEKTVNIVDEKGRRVPWGQALIWHADGAWDRRPWSAGRLQVPLIPNGSVDVWAPGCRVRSARIAELGASVVLQPECDAALVFPDLQALQGPSLRVVASLTPELRERRNDALRMTMGTSIQTALVGELGEARFRMNLPGRYAVQLKVQIVPPRSDSPGQDIMVRAKGDAARIDVLDVDGRQTFQLPIHPEDLESLGQALRSMPR
jgi:hypothetical protein